MKTIGFIGLGPVSYTHLHCPALFPQQKVPGGIHRNADIPRSDIRRHNHPLLHSESYIHPSDRHRSIPFFYSAFWKADDTVLHYTL